MKKIFTLIASAFIALSANAQTTISLAGLTTDDFTYDAAAYTPASDKLSFNYIRKSKNSYDNIVMTGKNILFSYKNSGEKSGFFAMKTEWFVVNGKGAILKISNVQEGQTITINVAKKEDPGYNSKNEWNNNVPGFKATGATMDGSDFADGDTKENFKDIQFTSTVNGDVEITNANNGYLIKSIVLSSTEADVVTTTYTFNNDAAKYVLGDNCAATTYGDNNNYSVNYTGAADAKMQVKVAENEEIFFEYSNGDGAQNNVIKTGSNYVQFDKKNFVINIKVKNGDKIAIKYYAKGDPATLEIYGDEPAIEEEAGSVNTCSGTTAAEAVTFKAVATKGGTAKIKETAAGMRLMSIAVTTKSETAVAGVAESKAEAKKVVKVLGANGIQIGNYNIAGQQVK